MSKLQRLNAAVYFRW